jgi:flagellar basal body-associated protein FliL
MSLLFLLSVLAFFAVGGLGGYRYYQLQKHRDHPLSEAEKSAKHLSEFIRRQAEENKRKAGLISLGSFTIELRAPQGRKKRPYGVFDMAEIELVLDCDSKETRDYIEEHQPQVRNQVTNYFTAIERAELMTQEGKKRVKKSLMERLNLWLPKGKVEDVYITKLLLT